MSSEYMTIPWLDMPENPLKARLAILQLFYGVPSIVLMIGMFVYMGCSKNYSNSFYRLVQMDLLTNIIGWLNSWVALRFAEFPFGNVYVRFILSYIPWFWNFSILVLTCMIHLQYLSAISLSIHRITSVLFFNSYEKFWKRYYLLVSLAFCFYSTLQNLFSSGKSPQMNLINGSLWYSLDVEGTKNFNMVINVFNVIYFVSLVGVGISVPIIVEKKFRGSVRDTDISKKLTKIALTTGFVYSGLLFWNILNAVNTSFNILPDEYASSISYSVLSTVSDMGSLALPYILLIYDANIKRDFIVFKKSRNEISTTMPVIVSS